MKKCCLIFLCFMLAAEIKAETTVLDSLKASLIKQQNDSNKVKTLLYISHEFQKTRDKELKTWATQALSLSHKLNYLPGKAKANLVLGNHYLVTSDYSNALKHYLVAVTYFEQLKNKQGLAKCFSNIGIIYSERHNLTLALDYYNKSKDICLEINNKPGLSSAYNEIGLLLTDLHKYDDALAYLKKALELNENLMDSIKILGNYNNIGRVHLEQKNYNKSIYYYEIVLKIYSMWGNLYGMAEAFTNLGETHMLVNDLQKAEYCFLKATALSKQLESLEGLKYTYKALTDVYRNNKNYKKAFEFSELYSEVKDSIFDLESSQQIAEMQTKYDTEKKEQEILILNKDKDLQNIAIEKQQAEIKQKNTQRNAFILGFILCAGFALVIYKNYQRKKADNILLTEQKQEIQVQKEIIEEKNREVTDSIRYAKRIQSAVIPSENYLREILPEHFVLFKPRDIVSGDFYWATEIIPLTNPLANTIRSKNVLLAAADCTGHGVPGALMSMMGINMINSIVNEKNITRPDLVLNELRETIIRSINTMGSEEERKDGMDIVLCKLNFEKKQLQFAAANNPLYLVRNGELLNYKPDKMPVGKYINEHNPFTLQDVDLHKGDTVYIFSDGYPDQFGGPDKKKFMHKNLQKLILEINNLPLAQQKVVLNDRFEEWKGDRKQIDDVLIIGLKIES